MSETAIAELDFLPVCSECKNILYGYTIDIVYDSDIFGTGKYNWKSSIEKKPHVYPQKCPFCNADFNSIMIPCKLPFKTKKGD